MSRVKEELYLSLIFVGKWLGLGLGIVGLIYLAINLAYKKSYYEPRMATFDLEISDFLESKATLEGELSLLREKQNSLIAQISTIETIEIPEADNQIAEAQSKIEKLGLNWWEKYDLPLIERNEQVEKSYEMLAEANNEKTKITESLDLRRSERE